VSPLFAVTLTGVTVGFAVAAGVAAAVAALLEAKRNAGRSPRYLTALRLLLGHFTRGREQQAVSAINAGQVVEFMDQLPTSGVGKILKRELKEDFKDKLN
jgi:acyl-CoA synthetase (AMP-forming)/AMP-acid ligase II